MIRTSGLVSAFRREALPVLMLALAILVPLFAMQQLTLLAPWLVRGAVSSFPLELPAALFPVFLAMSLPVAAGLSVAVVCSRWKEDGCWLGLETFGTSTFRRAVPVLSFGALLSLWLFALLFWAEPHGLRLGFERVDSYLRTDIAAALRPGVMNTVTDQARLIFDARNGNRLSQTVLLGGQGEQERILFAKEALLSGDDSGVLLKLRHGRMEEVRRPLPSLHFESATLRLARGGTDDLARAWPVRRLAEGSELSSLPDEERYAEWSRRGLLALSPFWFSLWAFGWFSMGTRGAMSQRLRWAGFLACCVLYVILSRYGETACLKQGLAAWWAVGGVSVLVLVSYGVLHTAVSPARRRKRSTGE